MADNITTRLKLDDDRPEINAGDKLDVTVDTSEHKTVTVTASEDITQRDAFQIEQDGQHLGTIRLFRGYNAQFDDEREYDETVIGYVAVHDDLLGTVETIRSA